jgi:hypothetical protein
MLALSNFFPLAKLAFCNPRVRIDPEIDNLLRKARVGTEFLSLPSIYDLPSETSSSELSETFVQRD